jgi:hypothetical protein
MLTHQYTAICEYARLEAGGKWIIIGLFPNGIGTPVVPFPLPVLTFFQVLRADAPGQYKMHSKLSRLDTGEIVAGARAQLQVQQAGPVILPVPLLNLQLKAFGTYTWSIEVEGQPEPFVTEFPITHVQQQIRIVPPPQF